MSNPTASPELGLTRRGFLVTTAQAAGGVAAILCSGAGAGLAEGRPLRFEEGVPPRLHIDHVSLAVRNIYEAADRLRSETGLGYCDGDWTEAGMASKIFPLGGGVYLRVDGIVDAQAVNDPSRPEIRRFFEAVAAGEHFSRFGVRVDTAEELSQTIRNCAFHADRSVHPSGRRPIAAPGLIAPRGLAWMEVGGTKSEMSRWLGTPPSTLPLRFNGGAAGVHAIAVKTDRGDVVLRR